MSAISLKSITGITSITTPAGVDNQLTLHNNNTTEAVKLDIAGNLHFHNHLNITGVSTASNFKTGTSNLHNTGLNVQDLDVDGHTNLDNVSVVGVTTITANNVIGLNVENSSGGGAQTTIRSKSTVANASNFVRSESSDNKYIGLLKYGTGHSAYGALAAGGGAVYANSSVPITIMSDGSYINFATGGNTERLRIASNGKITHTNFNGVGFTMSGTGDPTLQISDADGTNQYVQLAHNGGDSYIVTRNNTSHGEFLVYSQNGTDTLPRIKIANDGTWTKYLNSSSTPQAAFGGTGQINGITAMPSMAGSPLVVGRDTGSLRSASFGGNLNFATGYGIQGTEFEVKGTTNGLYLNSNVSGDAIIFQTHNGSSVGERIRITSDGTIEVKDSAVNLAGNAPAVKGKIRIGGVSDSTTAGGIEFHTSSGGGGGYGTRITSDASSNMHFLTRSNHSAWSEKVRITSGGQLVVGGTSSQASDAVTLMPDGEVTAAGFYFSNNIGSAMNNTGIRRATTNTMVFDTASTERLRIDADGNTSTKGSAMEHFVNKRVQSINSNGNSVQYVLVAPTGTNNLRLQGKFHFTRATGTSGIAQQTVEAQIMTNNTGGDAQYYVRTATTDQGSYSGMYYRWVTCDYNSTTYYALEGHPVTGSSYWGGFMQHGVYTGTANQCTNLGTVLNTTSHSITNITALTTRKAHERWYNTSLNVQMGSLHVKQGSGVNGAQFTPLYYDVNGAALPTQMKVHGQKAVCIDCTRYYTSGDIITFRINNDYEGAIYVNPSGVQYNSTSDYRLKENVIELTGAIDRVKQLKPKRFNFIKDPGNTMDGFMAHEVSSVVPNAVVGEKDAVKDILYEQNDEVIPEGKKIGDVKEKDAIDPQSMDDSKLVPLLTAALQEAIAKIETLETKVAALEGS